MQTDELIRQFISYSERLNDVVIDDLDYILNEHTSEVERTFRDVQSSGTGQLSQGDYSQIELKGVTVDRDYQDYFIATADNLGYARIYYVQNLVQNIITNSTLEQGETGTLEESDMEFEDGIDLLESNRDIPVEKINTQVVDLLSESNCEFYYNTSESDDIVSFQVSQKVFPETSLQEYDRTVQNVINTGLKTINQVKEMYTLETVEPQYLSNLQRYNR